MLFRDWWRIPTPYGYVELELDEPGNAPTDELELDETANVLDVLTYGIENRDPRITNAIVELYAQAHPESFPPGLALSSLSVRDIDTLRPSLIRYLEHQVAAGTIRLYEDDVAITQIDVLDPLKYTPQPVVPEKSDPPEDPYKPWIDLYYLRADGIGIANACYVVESLDGSVLADGQLNKNGFAHVGGLPIGTTQVNYFFLNDPQEHPPVIRPVPNPEVTYTPRFIDEGLVYLARALGAVEDAAQWTWEVLQGDFNKDPSIAQVVAGTAITLIPVVDQVGDARDLIANIYYLIEYYTRDEQSPQKEENEAFWLWAALVLTAIGLIPELGSAVKGVLKTVLRAVRESAGKVNWKQLVEKLFRILNHYDVGNAWRFLKRIARDLKGFEHEVVQRVKAVLTVIEATLRQVPDTAAKLRDRMLMAVRRMRDRVKAEVQRVFDWLDDKMKKVLSTDPKDKLKGNTNEPHTKTQTVEVPPRRTTPSKKPDPNAKPRGEKKRIQDDDSPENKLATKRENESAEILVREGYDVEQLKEVKGQKNPDYRIEGKVFDNKAPTTSRARNIASTMEDSIEQNQASRFVLNLSDSDVDLASLRRQLDDYPIGGLEEVIVIDKMGNVIPFWP